MKAIYKYPLPREGHFTLELPRVWVEVAIQMQDGLPTMWAYVDTDTERVQVEFRMFGTGHPVDDWADLCHIGTVQDSAYVWHYFQVVKE